MGRPDHLCGRGRPGLALQAFGLNGFPRVVLSTGTATAPGAASHTRQSCTWTKLPTVTSVRLSRERSVGLCWEFKARPAGEAGPPASAGQAAVCLSVVPVRLDVGLLFLKPVSLRCPSSRPRTDPAKRRHQLELPMPWGDGQWPVRGTVQGSLFLLPLQQGGCQGVGLCGSVPGHVGVHAEVPRPLPPGRGGGGGEASRSLTGSSCLRGQCNQRGGGVELMMAGALGSSHLQSPDKCLQESVFSLRSVHCNVQNKLLC